ncbi:MAG: VanZ family protein [Desulfobacterales bacterium]|nr:VanZ family protein [Desulfobacterales bacterium]
MNPSSKDDRGRPPAGPINQMRQTLFYRLPWIGFCILIFRQSSAPSPLDTFSLFPHEDKVMHFLAYGILAVLTARNMAGERPHWSPWAIGIFAVLFTTAFGLSDEIHQSFVPQRHASVLDLVADFFGACAGAWAHPRLCLRFPWMGPETPKIHHP